MVKIVVPSIIAIICVVALVVLSIDFVPYGHVAVVTHFNAIDVNEPIRQEGLNFKTPFVNNLEKVDVRTQKYPPTNVSSFLGEDNQATPRKIQSTSKDQQIVTTEAVILYSINPTKAPELLKNVRGYEKTLIAPISESTIKDVMGKYSAYDFVNNREVVEESIADTLKPRLSNTEKCQDCILVESVQLVNIDFSDQYDKAIENKNEATQKLDQARIELETRKVEAQQQIEKARGEAESIQIIDETLKSSPNYLEWLKIQNWDGKLPLVVGEGSSPLIQLKP